MKTTMDPAGRLVIPKEIRRAASLRPGAALEITYRDGRIEIEPAPLDVDLIQKGNLLVAVPREPVEPLTAELVEQTREAIWRERSGDR